MAPTICMKKWQSPAAMMDIESTVERWSNVTFSNKRQRSQVTININNCVRVCIARTCNHFLILLLSVECVCSGVFTKAVFYKKCGVASAWKSPAHINVVRIVNICFTCYKIKYIIKMHYVYVFHTYTYKQSMDTWTDTYAQIMYSWLYSYIYKSSNINLSTSKFSNSILFIWHGLIFLLCFLLHFISFLFNLLLFLAFAGPVIVEETCTESEQRLYAINVNHLSSRTFRSFLMSWIEFEAINYILNEITVFRFFSLRYFVWQSVFFFFLFCIYVRILSE